MSELISQLVGWLVSYKRHPMTPGQARREVLEGGGSAPCSGRDTHCTGGWVGLRAGLD